MDFPSCVIKSVYDEGHSTNTLVVLNLISYGFMNYNSLKHYCLENHGTQCTSVETYCPCKIKNNDTVERSSMYNVSKLRGHLYIVYRNWKVIYIVSRSWEIFYLYFIDVKRLYINIFYQSSEVIYIVYLSWRVINV